MVLMEVNAQLVSDRPCLSRATYTIGMASGTLEGYPNLYGFGQWNGPIPMDWVGTVLMCVFVSMRALEWGGGTGNLKYSPKLLT